MKISLRVLAEQFRENKNFTIPGESVRKVVVSVVQPGVVQRQWNLITLHRTFDDDLV